jgi:internalin A
MKTTKLVAVVVLAIFGTSDVWAAPEDLVYFEDSKLQYAVEIALGISDPNEEDMLQLTVLHAEGRGIQSLVGLEYAMNVKELALENNEVNDVSPLSGLTNLEFLRMSNNEVNDVSPLKDLVNLQHLGLQGNNVSDISPLSGLTNIKRFDLENNQITDISPLDGLTSLEYLDIRGNQIAQVSLSDLPSLWGIDLVGNGLNQITLSGSGLPNLQTLNVAVNQIGNVSGLAGVMSLKDLDLSYNQLSDISPLSGLTNLYKLWLNWNQLSDIPPLADLVNLEYLYAKNNMITDVSGLAGLTKLYNLDLRNNQISDISPLADLTNLYYLVMTENMVTHFPPLPGATQLAEIWLGHNKISDISGLATLVSVRGVDLSYNWISDIQPLVDNPEMDTDDTVVLTCNPLGDKAITTDIPILIDRGVDVIFDENAECHRPDLFVVIPGMNDGIDKYEPGGIGGLNLTLAAKGMSGSPYQDECYVGIIQTDKKGAGKIIYFDQNIGIFTEESFSKHDLDKAVPKIIMSATYMAIEKNSDLVVAIDMFLQDYKLVLKYWWPKWVNPWNKATVWSGEMANLVSKSFKLASPGGRRRLYSHSAGGDATYESIKGEKDKMFEDINILNGRTNADNLQKALNKKGYTWNEVKIFTCQNDLPAKPEWGFISGSISYKDAAENRARSGIWTHVHFNKVWINCNKFDPNHSILRDHFDVDADFEVYTETLNGQNGCGSLINVIETDWTSWSGTGECPQNQTCFDQMIETAFAWLDTNETIDPESTRDYFLTYIFEDSVMPEEFSTDSYDDLQPSDNEVDSIYKEWIKTEEAVAFMLFEVSQIIVELGSDSFNNEESAFQLACSIDDVFTMLDEDMYIESLILLENDILQRMDGFANIGQPDEDDWITSIEGQALLYPLVTETIELLESML